MILMRHEPIEEAELAAERAARKAELAGQAQKAEQDELAEHVRSRADSYVAPWGVVVKDIDCVRVSIPIDPARLQVTTGAVMFLPLGPEMVSDLRYHDMAWNLIYSRDGTTPIEIVLEIPHRSIADDESQAIESIIRALAALCGAQPERAVRPGTFDAESYVATIDDYPTTDEALKSHIDMKLEHAVAAGLVDNTEEESYVDRLARIAQNATEPADRYFIDRHDRPWETVNPCARQWEVVNPAPNITDNQTNKKRET